MFRENSENQLRAHVLQQAALTQFATEFRNPRSGFDRFIDGVNRLPRPAMAFGVLGLFIAAMVDPIWFADRMAGLSLVPEPYGGYWARLCPFILARVIKAKALKYGPRHAKTGPNHRANPLSKRDKTHWPDPRKCRCNRMAQRNVGLRQNSSNLDVESGIIAPYSRVYDYRVLTLRTDPCLYGGATSLQPATDRRIP